MTSSHAPIDANLLVALDALLDERSVTRAAQRLHVTQSAMSHKLRQLREQLGDELLVRGRNGMVLTERAQAMAEPLRQAVVELHRAIAPSAAFDPATARRRFVVSSSDYGELVAMPAMLAHLGRAAPGIDIVIEAPTSDLHSRLESGRLDLAIGPPMAAPTGILRRKLYIEGFLVALRAGHPRAGKRLDLASYVALDHLLIAPRDDGAGPVDRALEALGLERRVALRMPHFAAAPFIAAATDLALTAPAGLLRAASRYVALRLYPPPVSVPEVPIFLYWHERVDRDPAHRWLRSLHDLLARSLRGEAPEHDGESAPPRAPRPQRARAGEAKATANRRR